MEFGKSKKILVTIVLLLVIGIIICMCLMRYKTCMLGHHYEPATCEKSKTCRLCDSKEGQALGHKYEKIDQKEPTCTDLGSEYYKCSVCSKDYTVPIELIEHSYENGYCTMCKKEDKRCWACEGEGRRICTACYGTGTYYHGSYMGVPITPSCRTCYGDGYKKCEFCVGTGKKDYLTQE